MFRAGALHHGPRRPGVRARSAGVSACQDVVRPMRREHALQRGMVERRAFLFEVGRERGEVLGHVTVDVDDGVVQRRRISADVASWRW